MSLTTEKPVVTFGTVAGAIAALWPAVLAVTVAFNWWDPTEAQLASISALWVAVIGVITGLMNKTAASRVFIPASAQAMADASHEKAHAEDAERVRVAESFGRPDQAETPATMHPTGEPIGGRLVDPHDPTGHRAGKPPL